jgi:hypothetical protein
MRAHNVRLRETRAAFAAADRLRGDGDYWHPSRQAKSSNGMAASLTVVACGCRNPYLKQVGLPSARRSALLKEATRGGSAIGGERSSRLGESELSCSTMIGMGRHIRPVAMLEQFVTLSKSGGGGQNYRLSTTPR